MSDKIINFQQRRQLEQAIAGFANTSNELELAEAARQVAHNFPLDLVLTALLKHLDTSNSQMRGGLGHLAALLPSDEAIAGLRTIAANRQQAPLARLTAALIAHRFLGIELPATLTSDLNNTDNAALQSLLEAIDEGKRNRHILLEYVEQMRELGEEIAFLVMDALERVPPTDCVELLHLIAQDSRPQVAKAALTRLEQLASTEASATVLRALHTLQSTLPADLSAQAERSLRKLRMSGRRYDPPAAAGWRAVLSPAEPNGSQVVWLVYTPEDASVPGALLGFALNLEVGVLRFFGSETVDRSVLPAAQPVGNLFIVKNDAGGNAIVLEVPFDYGRWLVARALAAQRADSSTQSLSGDYQLYNDRIWEYAPPVVDETVQRYWRPGTDAQTTEVAEASLHAQVDALFAHPVMENWNLQSGAVVQTMPPPARPKPDLPIAETVGVLLREIAKWPESAGLAEALARGLRGQATWLHFAGQPELGQSAWMLANAMPHLPLVQNPVLAHLLAASLRGQP